MAGQEKRDSQRVPVALRIKLRFRKVDTFVSKFATNISTHGMFISSRKPKKPGTQLRFELRLADDSTVIAGRGVVTWVRPFKKASPKEPHGMGIEFIGLSSDSRELISRMVSVRIDKGLGDEGIPFAVQDPDANVRRLQAVDVAEAEAQAAPPSPPASQPDDLSLQALVDGDIDVDAVLRRARSIVGSEAPDSELARLARVSAAPVAETVDVASHELAKILGGSAIVSRVVDPADPPTDYAALAEESLEEDSVDVIAEDALDVVADGSLDVLEDDALDVLEDDAPDVIAEDVLEEDSVDVIAEDALDVIAEDALEVIADDALDVLEDDSLDVIAEDVLEDDSLDVIAEDALEVLEDDSLDVIAEAPLEDSVDAQGTAPESELSVASQTSAQTSERSPSAAEPEAEEQAPQPLATQRRTTSLQEELDAEVAASNHADQRAHMHSDDDVLPMMEDEATTFSPAPTPLDTALLALGEDHPTNAGDEVPALEMLEEVPEGLLEETAAGFERDYADEETKAGDPLPIEQAFVQNRAPTRRAETELQELGSYDELAAEQEFASAPDAATRMQQNPLDDLLGQLESEVAQDETKDDPLAVLDELEQQQLDDLAMDDFEVIEEQADEQAAPATSGLDAALASFGDVSDDDDEIETDLNERY